MKRVLFLSAIITLTACTLNNEMNREPFDEHTDLKFPQKLKLVQMSGSIPNSETTGNDMPWQEYYILDADYTFIKSRTQNNTAMEATGTYTFVTLSDGKYLELTHTSDTDLVGSCMSNSKKEYLMVISKDQLQGTWAACDGPGLVYRWTDQ